MLLAEANNPYQDLDCFRITKTRSNHFSITHRFEENNVKYFVAWNTACSWKSCIVIATYHLVSYLLADY